MNMLPSNELWLLCESAYHQYQQEIMNSDKLYHRYVKDFISYNLPIESPNIEDWRIHSKNISSLQELLTERTDLVEKYFNQKTFSLEDYTQMIHEFNTQEAIQKRENQIATIGIFSDEQLTMIVQFANENALFMRNVTKEDMALFFNATLTSPLQVENIGKMSMFMNCLYDVNLITHKWQSIIETHKLLSSPKSGKELQRSTISTCLNSYKEHHAAPFQPFATFAKELKGKMANEE
ncbi:MAG: hypothetical protein ACRC8J_01595 [Phocaeicola sp.]